MHLFSAKKSEDSEATGQFIRYHRRYEVKKLRGCDVIMRADNISMNEYLYTSLGKLHIKIHHLLAGVQISKTRQQCSR